MLVRLFTHPSNLDEELIASPSATKPVRKTKGRLTELFERINSRLSVETKLFIFVFIVFALTILPLVSPNERSHFALAKAILTGHSFAINNYTHFVVIDLSQ